MKNITKYRPLNELRRIGFEALVGKMGLADALRFMSQYDPGKGDYSKERKTILKGIKAEEFFKEAQKYNRGSGGRKKHRVKATA